MNQFFLGGLRWVNRVHLALSPQRIRNDQRIYLSLLPPLSFLCCVVQLLVMCGAEWDRKLIADLDAQSASLRISHMVGVGG